MFIPDLHKWDISPKEGVELQRRLRRRIKLTPLERTHEIIAGAALRSRTNVRPLFVSPGHLIDIRDSTKIVLNCCGRFRLPEPPRQAHILVNRNRSGK